TGRLIECGTVTNGAFSCTASNVCAFGSLTFTTGWGNTSYHCSVAQYGSGTTYANRALNFGIGTKASGVVPIVASAPSTVANINVSVDVNCTE
ncbi:MAG: hypothetical protein ABSF08_03805, partial [Candidatus Cybelea sp.]